MRTYDLLNYGKDYDSRDVFNAAKAIIKSEDYTAFQKCLMISDLMSYSKTEFILTEFLKLFIRSNLVSKQEILKYESEIFDSLYGLKFEEKQNVIIRSICLSNLVERNIYIRHLDYKHQIPDLLININLNEISSNLDDIDEYARKKINTNLVTEIKKLEYKSRIEFLDSWIESKILFDYENDSLIESEKDIKFLEVILKRERNGVNQEVEKNPNPDVFTERGWLLFQYLNAEIDFSNRGWISDLNYYFRAMTKEGSKEFIHCNIQYFIKYLNDTNRYPKTIDQFKTLMSVQTPQRKTIYTNALSQFQKT